MTLLVYTNIGCRFSMALFKVSFSHFRYKATTICLTYKLDYIVFLKVNHEKGLLRAISIGEILRNRMEWKYLGRYPGERFLEFGYILSIGGI